MSMVYNLLDVEVHVHIREQLPQVKQYLSHDKYHEIDVMFDYLDYSDHLNVLELQRFEQKTNHVDQEFLALHHSPLNVCYFEPLNIYYKHLKLSFVQVPSKQHQLEQVYSLTYNKNLYNSNN